MGKVYAYCPQGFVAFVERRTKGSSDPYPLNKYYHGSLLPFFKEVPESQENEVKQFWYYDETTGLFREPEVGEEVGGQIYIGLIPKEAFWTLQEENVRLSGEIGAFYDDFAAAFTEGVNSIDQ